MKALVMVLVASAACAQNAQPDVTNAHFETRAFSGDLASQLNAGSPTWFAYEVKTATGDHRSCCWNGADQCGCSLEDGSKNERIASHSNTPVQLEGSDRMAVLFRIANNKVEKIQAYSLSCPLDAGGLPFVWLTGVPAKASLAYLERLVASSNSDHVVNGAIFAISQHENSEALNLLIQMAKNNVSPHIRGQAIFWLAQKAGQRAVSTIDDAIKNDPDTSVKRQAVFALSQLPKDEGVPKLIEVASTQRNPEVRKQAFFWLGQSQDPRALAFIEQVLTK